MNLILVIIIIASGTIGGCGGGGDSSADNGGGGVANCTSPGFTTDFTGDSVFFVDSQNNVLIGLSSNGVVVAILLSDIPFSGALIGLGGVPISASICDILLGLLDVDGDFDFSDEILFNADGNCMLQDGFTEFVLNNLSILGLPLNLNLRGLCDEIVEANQLNNDIDLNNDINKLSNMMFDKLDELDERHIITNKKQSSEENTGNLIFDFHQRLMDKIEE